MPVMTPSSSGPVSLLRGSHWTEIPAHLKPWLLDRGSLTQRLEAACGQRIVVEVLAQGWARPLPVESVMLELIAGRYAWVRQVRLRCTGTPWVYARTVIPRATLTGRERRLTHLKNRSLGAVLFSDPTMRRGETAVGWLTPRERCFHAATDVLNPAPAFIPGRRTLFWLSGKPLLVSEFFLPAVGEFPA
jgi:chorismate--pyruvate lyase